VGARHPPGPGCHRSSWRCEPSPGLGLCSVAQLPAAAAAQPGRLSSALPAPTTATMPPGLQPLITSDTWKEASSNHSAPLAATAQSTPTPIPQTHAALQIVVLTVLRPTRRLTSRTRAWTALNFSVEMLSARTSSRGYVCGGVLCAPSARGG